MFAIVVNEKGGDQKRLEFDKPEVTIGRVQGNDIILPKGNVSKRHSRIVLKDGKFIIVDLKSTNGTYVNGRKITSPLVVKGSDKIYIGDFILGIEEAQAAIAPVVDEPPPVPPAAVAALAAAAPLRKPNPTLPPPPPRRPTVPPAATEADETDHAEPQAPEPAAPEAARARAPSSPAAISPARPVTREPLPARPAPARPASVSRPPSAAQPARPPSGAAPARAPAAAIPTAKRPSLEPQLDEAKRARVAEAMRDLAGRLWAALDLGDRGPEPADDELLARADSNAQELAEQLSMETGLPEGVEPAALARQVAAETLGLGPLAELLADSTVRAISVPRPERIYVDRGEGITLAPQWFSSADAVTRVLYRLLYKAGRIGEVEHARADGILEARLEDGTVISAALSPLSSRGPAIYLRRPRAGGVRLADLVAEGVLSSGMAELLELAVRGRRNVLVSGGPASGRSTLLGALARVVAAEERVVTVEESEELDLGSGPWTQLTVQGGQARAAVRAALRLHPERLVMGDLRGAEALDLVSALAGGQEGCLCVAAAASPRDALERVVQLARLAPEAPSVEILREELAATVHVVVHLTRHEGETRVAEIAEVGPGLTTQPVFAHKRDAGTGRFQASGHVPNFAEGAPPSMFRSG